MCPLQSGTSFSDLFEADDPDFLNALSTTILPGDIVGDTQALTQSLKRSRSPEHASFEHQVLPADSKEASDYTDNDTYGAARFGEYGEYMRRKRAKLQIQNANLKEGDGSREGIFTGLAIYVRDVPLVNLESQHNPGLLPDQRENRPVRSGASQTDYGAGWCLPCLSRPKIPRVRALLLGLSPAPHASVRAAPMSSHVRSRPPKYATSST